MRVVLSSVLSRFGAGRRISSVWREREKKMNLWLTVWKVISSKAEGWTVSVQELVFSVVYFCEAHFM